MTCPECMMWFNSCSTLKDQELSLKAQLAAVTKERDNWKARDLRMKQVESDYCVRAMNAEKAEAAEKEKIKALEAEIIRKDEALQSARKLAYEIEGGNRWPVEWSEESKINNALLAFKTTLISIGQDLPEWVRNGPPGWKREALKPQEKP